jgi:hypothetical protein
MGNCLKCLSKNARELKEWCTEIVDDESVAARHEASKEEHEAKRGKIRKWLGKFDYLKEAWIFSSMNFSPYLLLTSLIDIKLMNLISREFANC